MQKPIWIFVLSALVTFSGAQGVQVAGAFSDPGDVNGDAWITLEDAVLAARLASSGDSTGDTEVDGDANSDGKIGVEELVYVLQQISRLRIDDVWFQCGVLGDSIGEATHADDSCDRNPGEHRELMDCLDLRLGAHDSDWSFSGGSKSWSIASRIGCAQVDNRAHDGDEWKDALDQAKELVQGGPVGRVVLNLGSNDVCENYGHDYGSLAFVQSTLPAHIVSIEGEHFIERLPGQAHQWEPENTAGASIVVVRAEPDTGTTMTHPDYLASSPRLDYRVNFVTAGTHYVWIRGYADGAGSRLVHVGLDGARQEEAENIEVENDNEWTWTRATVGGTAALIAVSSPGEHTLNIYMGDDGFRLDRVLLTSEENWTPLAAGPAESARGVIAEANELAAIEVEHYHHQEKSGSHSWVPDFQEGYAGGAAMRALPDEGAQDDDTGTVPRLDFNVRFNQAGTYTIWVRGYATGDDDDSVHVGVDGTSSPVEFSSRDTWAWSNSDGVGGSADVEVSSPGIHTVNIWMREDGFRADKLVLTTNAAYEPSDWGPEERWENDLGLIAGQIDDTIQYLTEHLPASGEIYWSGTADISKLRDLMWNRKHDHAFEQCQYLWDLDLRSGALQGDAIKSLCEGLLGEACQILPDELQTQLLDVYVNEFMDDYDDDTPCGRVLDSRNSQADRDEARRFNKSLNDLMEQKAAQFHGRRGVGINFTQALWYRSHEIRPYYLSRIDCFHPNRQGQMKMAQMVWQGHNPGFTNTDAFFYEGFDSADWCEQEFTSWGTCWEEGGFGECGDEFICSNDNSGWFKFGKETSNNEDHWIGREAGDLSDKSEVWAYFKHKRDHFDDESDWVGFFVWDGSSWDLVETFREHNDTGNHCSRYYDLTPYKDASPFKIKFETNNSSNMKNGDKLMLDELSIFAW
jgi:hypothetical protein